VGQIENEFLTQILDPIARLPEEDPSPRKHSAQFELILPPRPLEISTRFPLRMARHVPQGVPQVKPSFIPSSDVLLIPHLSSMNVVGPLIPLRVRPSKCPLSFAATRLLTETF